MLAIVVGICLHFVPPPLRACASQYAPRATVVQQLRGGELPTDIAALIGQLREAEVALRALEADGGDTSDSTLATKSKLEQSVRAGVAKLRELGMPDDQIMMMIMEPNVGQPSQSVASPSTSSAAADPVSDRPLSRGMTNGVILIRDKD